MMIVKKRLLILASCLSAFMLLNSAHAADKDKISITIKNTSHDIIEYSVANQHIKNIANGQNSIPVNGTQTITFENNSNGKHGDNPSITVQIAEGNALTVTWNNQTDYVPSKAIYRHRWYTAMTKMPSASGNLYKIDNKITCSDDASHGKWTGSDCTAKKRHYLHSVNLNVVSNR